MKKEERKYSRLSIIAFSLISASIILVIPLFFKVGWILFPLLFLIALSCIIISPIALIRIKKENLKGKFFAITALVLSILTIIFLFMCVSFIIYLSFFNKYTTYYIVPLNISLKADNLQIKDYLGDSEPDIYILVDGSTENGIPKNCSLDYLNLELTTPFNNITASKYSINQISFLKESLAYPANEEWMVDFVFKGKNPEQMLKNDNDLFLFYYSSPFVTEKFPSMQIMQKKGCNVHYPNRKIDERILISDRFNKTLHFQNEAIVCLKEFDNSARDMSDIKNRNNCTFFKINSDMILNLKFDTKDLRTKKVEKPRTSRYIF